MPHPAQITRDALIARAWEMAEAEGVEQMTLAKLAAALGVKAPSLYHHMRSKADLLRAINERTTQQLFAALHETLAAASDAPAAERIHRLAAAYRAFAQAHPITYMLAFTTVEVEARPDPTFQEQGVLPIQAVLTELTGADASLAAIRGLLALMHGFVMLEINDQFRRGGDLDAAYTQGIEVYLRGITG
ncbi:MAG: TetR/AcrR family transcriptional regulator [bacterium]|nr:TetR/AcrR family transcriptional regulator [bacterium]